MTLREVERAVLAGDLTASLPPLALAQVLEAHYRQVDAAVQRHGGRVVKFMGDGFFALFGGAEAVRCAVELRDAVRAAQLPKGR